MKHSHYMQKFALLTAISGIVAVALAGCGSDDKPSGGTADCSKCAASSKDQCNKTFSDCTAQGGGADCQKAVDLLCALTGAFDAGKKD
jgi:hypothetical protein